MRTLKADLLPQDSWFIQSRSLSALEPDFRFEWTWACGPPIGMKIGLCLCSMLLGRGRHRSIYALDEVRPFLSLIGNARFEPIYVAPPVGVRRVVARDGAYAFARAFCRIHARRKR